MQSKLKEISPLEHRYILGMRVDATSYKDATERILAWAEKKQSKCVCLANVHMTMETFDNPKFAQTVNSADLVAPDGMPLVWALGSLGVKETSRVYGPTLTLYVCEAATLMNISIALYGGTPESLAAFAGFLEKKFRGINIVCQISPPFRKLSPEEDAAYTRQIAESGAQILFVGIGCPRQELWIAEHKDQIPAVMLGVGAAFDFHSGRVKQAPMWMQKIGLEWLFRLIMEPRRLWKRYFLHNPRYILFFTIQLIGSWLGL
ncbi:MULTISPECIES: WecB/TagA/CpsF family glycosyltransferase [unclassified Nodularia (in: cyanobacteria)]|uniref:WecB/TagA/CpsF family glycosyltransferase n=1 Tax=unclassified Nodularia (in: cyanobacteria) TaxID=2656917 RepID=UPI001882776E|nr:MULTISPECIES: WecB/TagA/CpsF family glycosyltransferase [unclassified Nodularia (in: cyanobacteria)]MBE9198542.1 WecB/TagA/CpsF family glycosyltransferase [Nodularia sp. LEGE 06071]MCC2693606.1 WecB/TagA/CpsF family glycosyltransferase [Nodularia sp. LEGE 04288]